MKTTSAQWLIRSVAVVAMLAGGVQILLGGFALLNAFSLASHAGLTGSGWLVGVVIPALQIACVCAALRAAWVLRRTGARKRAALSLAGCLMLELILFAMFALLLWQKDLHYNSPGEWFVADYAALPPNEIFGRSAPIAMGISLPVALSGFVGTLPLVLVAMVFLVPSIRGALTAPTATRVGGGAVGSR